MKLSIVIIGDEILLGRVTDTNSGLIAKTFSEAGWQVAGVRTVGDNAADINAAISQSLDQSDLVITTGGLGPTRDDITKSVLTDIFGGSLNEDPAVTANIEKIFAGRGLVLNDLTRRQAWVPTSCRVVMNRFGTAPVMWFERNSHVLVAMPGVPFETRGMLGEVKELVTGHFGTADHIRHHEFTVTGITESDLAERLASFEDSLPLGFKLAYLPSPGEILLRLDGAPGAPDSIFDIHARNLRHILGDNLAGEGKLSPAEIALHKLRGRKWTLATAESCTGGNIAHLFTIIPGCSDTFKGGIVSYANDVKTGILGVDIATLATVGAVSDDTVRQMAEGAAAACHADCAVATSGIAGPGGGTPEKPVGTVWIAARTPQRSATKLCRFTGDRTAVIDRASAAAINLLCDLLD